MIKTLAFILLQIGIANEKILSSIQEFQNSDGIKNGIVSIHVRNCETNDDVLKFNESQSVNSASILKLVSTGAILKELGPDFMFRTDLLYSGQIVDQTLNGNLIIKGSGDPSLGSSRYEETKSFVPDLILNLKKLGINKINGRLIIIDPEFFNFDHPDSWIWGDMGNYYGAMPHQFNFNENLYSVYFNAPYKLDEPVEIGSISPYSKKWEVNNIVKTGPKGSGDQVYIYTSPGSRSILMKGTVPSGAKNFEVKGSIPHPAQLAIEFLSDQLNFNGIEIDDPVIDGTNFILNPVENTFLIHSFYSPPLAQLIQDCNFKSINLYADAFTQKMAVLEKDSYSLPQGAEILQKYWSDNGAQLDGFNLKDGSGLSPSGLVTGEGMTSILSLMSKEYYFPQFLASIPVLGESGTVKYLDRKNITKGRVHAKSGSINGTRSYAGYARANNGELYAFSFIVNRYDNSYKQEVRTFLENILIDVIDLDQ